MAGPNSLTLRDGQTRRELAKVELMRDAIALRKEFPSLGRIENEAGIEKAEQYITVNLQYITEVLGMQLNGAQADDCVQSVLLIRWLTVADFKAFLEFCKHKKFYYRDYKEFLDTFHEYINTSLDTAEGDNYQKHLDIKAQEAHFAGERTSKALSLKDIAFGVTRKNSTDKF